MQGETRRVSYVPVQKKAGDGGRRAPNNSIKQYANKIMKSELAQMDGVLHNDFQKILEGHCIYLPYFFCSAKDLTLLESLKADLDKEAEERRKDAPGSDESGEMGPEGKGYVDGMINWSKHLKHENPDFSPTFKKIIDQMSEYFDVEVYATRLNYYRDGTDWKPFHHDSHAYSGGNKEDFTMGASFGASRELVFLHEASGRTFGFPQNNGDIFAFTSEANSRFMHGVPKTSVRIGERFSLIAWGRRRTINERNGGKGPASSRGTVPYSPSQATPPGMERKQEQKKEEEQETLNDEQEATSSPSVGGNTTTANKQEQKKAGGRGGRGRGGRLQGGIWSSGGGGGNKGNSEGGRGRGRGRGSDGQRGRGGGF